ncbi:hypothetical protein C8T65DRAFT_742992 [Cerioporus squamosus]|nr:hypothetical protein C8T65DRAFT_742992 [Cerioporus squamosus]
MDDVFSSSSTAVARRPFFSNATENKRHWIWRPGPRDQHHYIHKGSKQPTGRTTIPSLLISTTEPAYNNNTQNATEVDSDWVFELGPEGAEEDFVDVNRLGVLQVQPRCLSKLDLYRGRITALRAIYDFGILRNKKDAIPHLEETGLQATDLPGLPGTAFEKIQEYKTRMRGLRAVYNSAAPVNRILPVELLIEIFSYLRPDFNRRWGMSILHICRFWTDVMYKTPQFWANLLATPQEVTELSGRKLNRYRLALRHSGAVHLSLTFLGLPVVLAELLRPHANRIAHLHVDIARSIDGLNLLLEADMPILACLRINPWINNPWFSGRPGRLSADYVQLPKTLPALYTVNVAARHFALASSSLRRLELTSCWCAGCHARDCRFDSILIALSQCPSLEGLFLTKCLPEDDSHPDRLQGRCSPMLRATLPRLRCLTIESKRHSVAIILPRLIVPPTTLLELKIPGRFKLPSPIDMRSFPAINTADRVSLDLNDPERSLAVFLETYDVHDRPMLSIKGTSKDYRWADNGDRDPSNPYVVRYTQDVADIFAATTTVTFLSITGRLMERPRPPHNPWVTILDTFPSLQQLDIGQPVDDLPFILDILSRPGEDGRPRCPSLHTLYLLWLSEGIWPWIVYPEDEKSRSSLLDSMGPPRIYWYYKEDCDRIRDLRESSTAHVETDDKRTWFPYGIAETQRLAEAVKSCLSRREALGAAPLKRLHIGILPARDILKKKAGPQSPEDRRRDQEYVDRYYPDEPADTRLAKLLDGQNVELIDVYHLED